MKKSILDNFTPEDVNYRKAEFLPGKLHGPCCFYCDRAKHSLSDRSRDCDLLKGEVSDSNVCDWYSGMYQCEYKAIQLLSAVNYGIKYAGQMSREDEDNKQKVAYHTGVIDANRQMRDLIAELWDLKLQHYKKEL